MTVLNQLYASGGDKIIHDTLAITDGVETHYLTNGWDDITARLETGEWVTFIACGMALALPAKNADGTQDLQFALSNITGEISAYIQEVLTDKRRSELVYRAYIEDDLEAPAEAPYRFEIKSGRWTATQVDIVAGYFNLLETGWPRKTYNLIDFPMLRHIA